MKNAAIVWTVLCLCLPTLLSSQILINEFYADVALGNVGDANGDGTRSAKEDEFIELINPTNEPVVLADYTIWVSEILRHTFDSTTLFPNAAIVVFGGGQPTGIFGGSQVVVASSGALGLGNSGTKVELKNPQGMVIEEFIYPDENTNTSWTRDPDIVGGFKSHFQVVAAYGMPFSPGALNNSFPFNSTRNTLVHFHQTKGNATEGDSIFKLPIYLINPSATTSTSVSIEIIDSTAPLANNFSNFNTTIYFSPDEKGLKYLTVPIIDDEQVEGVQTFQFAIEQVAGGEEATISLHKQFTLTLEDNDFDFPLLLNEIHADPATGIEGDANGDGIRDAKEDEFLEFVNISEEVLDISNFKIFDADALRHEIPSGTVVAPNQAFVVFGGGQPMGDFGNAIVQTASSSSLNLLNTEDKIVLKDTNGVTVYAYSYGVEASDNQSITRYPDIMGDLETPHSTVGNGSLFSPGTGVEAVDFSTTVASQEVLIEEEIIIFPNPTDGSFYVESSLDFLKLEIFNYQGQRLLVTKERLITRKLETGIYFLKIYTEEGLIMKKIEVL